MDVNAILTTYHRPGFQRFCREVVSNNYVIKSHNVLFTCALEARSCFLRLTTSPGFCGFLVISGGGGTCLIFYNYYSSGVIYSLHLFNETEN